MQFSDQIRASISQGQAEAFRLGNDFIGTEHLLLGLLHCNHAIDGWLQQLNVDAEKLKTDAERLVRGKTLRKVVGTQTAPTLPLSEQAEKVILGTIREAKTRKSTRVEAHDLFVSIVRNNTSLDLLDPHREAV
jgi:ATP-dependent Clp protease ATP-binding subunit ClpC